METFYKPLTPAFRSDITAGAIYRKQKEKKEDRSRQITGTRGDI